MPSAVSAPTDQDWDHDHLEDLVVRDPKTDQQGRDDPADRQDDEARRKGKHQRFHGSSLK